jgi:hypothetical protein
MVVLVWAHMTVNVHTNSEELNLILIDYLYGIDSSFDFFANLY